MDILREISGYLENGDAGNVIASVQTALDNGYHPEEILKSGLLCGMEIVGEKYKNNEIYIPHVLLAARAMNAGLEVLRPRLTTATGGFIGGRALIGTVKGDLHDLGKNMVKAMLEREGFEVYDLGRDVGEEEFVNAVREYRPHVLGISATMTTTMGGIRDVIKALEGAGLRNELLIMIGGLPVTDVFAQEIGADICSIDAGEAAYLARRQFLSAIQAEKTRRGEVVANPKGVKKAVIAGTFTLKSKGGVNEHGNKGCKGTLP
ncbi:cobalamin B12-binding domain-containing protein [Zhaonella formicivorans]|uniref:cobalamin B12-binding domain-containing protein n=1 Tax=Zhaonella formicivorans TaxID=2528593 RepID=UPI001D11BA0C|nr:corrinoid protein [Zhaonella formicivorans]